MTETLRVRPVYRDAERDVLAIESSGGHDWRSKHGFHAYRSIRPVAIVVRSASGVTALNLDGVPFEIETLGRELQALIDANDHGPTGYPESP